MEIDLKRTAIKVLLNGGMIASNGRVLDVRRNPIVRISEKTVEELKPLLRKYKLVYLINKSEVRRLHGNSFIKKQYKKSQKK